MLKINPNKIDDDLKNDVREMLQSCKIEDKKWEETLYRLFTLSPTHEEKKWWIGMGIWKRGKICMGEDEMSNLPVTFALWHLTRIGILRRVTREKMSKV